MAPPDFQMPLQTLFYQKAMNLFQLHLDYKFKDEKKLAFLTSTDCDFKYKYGLSLIIKENREDTKVKIFIDGKIDNVY